MNKYTFKTFLENLITIAEDKIKELVNQELTGKQKKRQLDNTINNYLTYFIDDFGVNFVVKFVVKKWVIPQIPAITQIIYNLIQTRVNGVTK